MPIRPTGVTERPDAVLFDCDGTLADTEPISDRAWQDVLAGYGYTMTSQDVASVVGQPFAVSYAHYATKVDLADPARIRGQLRERFLARFETEMSLHRDAVDTLRSLVTDGVPVAVVSSSGREHVDRVLRWGELTAAVPLLVTAEDVDEHKPAPEPYLLAASRLGVDPTGCTVVEDTSVGIASGLAAGCFVVGVRRAHNDASSLTAAHRVVDEVTAGSLTHASSGAS